MIRHTGGRWSFATSTRSSPACRASSIASEVGITPRASLFAPMTRIGDMRMDSLIRCDCSIAEPFLKEDGNVSDKDLIFYPPLGLESTSWCVSAHLVAGRNG